MVTIDDSNYKNVNSKILIECDIKSSKKCKQQYFKGYRSVLKTRENHNGKDVCIYCHNKTFNTGEKNGSFKYRKNEKFFEYIDSEIKAYLLGLIAGDGSIENTGKRVVLYANKNDVESLQLFAKKISPDSPILNDEGCFNVRLDSIKIVSDICLHLNIQPGAKHDLLSLPNVSESLMWHFIRGLIDSDGSISDPTKGCTSPRCKLTSNSKQLLEDIKILCLKYNINSSIGPKDLYFTGIHAQNFMNQIYLRSNFHLSRKYDRYSVWKTWRPQHGTIVRPRKNAVN